MIVAMATDERESNVDQADEEKAATVNQKGSKSVIKTEEINEQETKEEKLANEITNTSNMLISGYQLPPERWFYSPGGTQHIGTKSIAETYVTRSTVERYGPIVSPTVSPVKSHEISDMIVNRQIKSSHNHIELKTDRDYETAALICSMRDSVNSRDTMRVSRMSTLLKPGLSVSNEYPNTYIKREPFSHGPATPHRQVADSDKSLYIKLEENGKDSSNSSSSHSDDTDHSDGENEDYSMIVRPREPHHGNDGISPNCCRLPCCSRGGYRTHSPENGTYSPIRVPARRPGQYPSPSHGEQGSHFGRHRDSNKSAFTAVSPGQKRHDSEFTPSSMPSVKVRVIQERTSETEKLTNGIGSKGVPEKVMFKDCSQAVTVKSEPESKTIISGVQESKIRPKNGDFSFIKSALTTDRITVKSAAENPGWEEKYASDNFVIPRPTAAYINGKASSYSVSYTAPFSGGYDINRRDAAQNGHTTPVVQCSTVDSTATEPDGESRLLDLARVANEHLGEELAKQQPASKRVKQKSNDCLHLWEFLRDILNNESMSPRAIEWTVKERGEFRLIKTGVVAQLWGLSKNRTSMTYEKMARAMRYYYKMKILEKVPHKRLHFRFGKHMLPKVLALPNVTKD